jgi:hypothetical protein
MIKDYFQKKMLYKYMLFQKNFLMAERAGFEPAKELPLYTLSKRAP